MSVVQVCWVYNTYYLPYEERIPRRGEHRDTIGYYQWVSLLLCTMVSWMSRVGTQLHIVETQERDVLIFFVLVNELQLVAGKMFQFTFHAL